MVFLAHLCLHPRVELTLVLCRHSLGPAQTQPGQQPVGCSQACPTAATTPWWLATMRTPAWNPWSSAWTTRTTWRTCLLTRKGYGVTLLTNATKAQLRAGLARLVTALTPGAVVVVFFSGHGVERGGENYLVPVGGEPEAPGTCGCACGCVCVAVRPGEGAGEGGPGRSVAEYSGC